MTAGLPFPREVGPLTPTQAACLPADVWEDFSPSDLSLTDADRERAAAVWLWLVGVAPDDDEAPRVRREVLADGGLIVALHLPAVEFLRWFRAATWADFDSRARTQSEAWAWQALQRAWGACEALGALAGQRTILGMGQ